MAGESITGGRIKVTFTETAEFAAKDAAERWCAERGISVGYMERGKPRGLLYGDFAISKWHNLRKSDIAALDGRMTGDMRHGPVHIDVLTPPLVEAKKEDDHAVEA